MDKKNYYIVIYNPAGNNQVLVTYDFNLANRDSNSDNELEKQLEHEHKRSVYWEIDGIVASKIKIVLSSYK